MIISHRHRFIFIKPQKTAGTSVELLLSRACGPNDVITPLGFDPNPQVRENNRAKAPQHFYRPKPLKHWQLNELFWWITKGRKPNLNYWEHLPATEIRQYVGEQVWNSYTKIAIVRNPWDHAVSQFKWLLTYQFGGVTDDFRDFLKYRYHTLWPFYSSYGEYDIDFMIHFENLQSDIIKLSNTLKLDIDTCLPHTKISAQGKRDIGSYYEEETLEIVRFKNLQLLEQFDYTCPES